MARLITLALPTAAALGSALPGVGPLFGFHVATLVLALVALAFPPNRSGGNLSRSVMALATVWLTFGAVGILLASDANSAIRTMTSILLGLILAVSILRIACTDKRLVWWLTQGWIISFIVTSSVAVWELWTGQHLNNYFLTEPGLVGKLPASTFFNPNAFAIYLVGVQAVLLWTISHTRRLSVKITLTCGSLLCAFLIVATGSRLCLVGFILLTSIFLALDRIGLRRTLGAAAVVGVLVYLAAPGTVSAVSSVLPDDVRNTTVSGIFKEARRGDTSLGRRLELMKSAGWLTIETAGLGVGPGNFGTAMLEMQPPYETGDTLAPHSFIGELTSEFGVIVLCSFAVFLWTLTRRVLKRPGPERAVLIATGLAFVPASFANSGYLLASSMWMLFATMLCLAHLTESSEA